MLMINSNLAPIVRRFRDMASFPSRMYILPTSPFNLEIEHVFLVLNCGNFACLGLRRRAN